LAKGSLGMVQFQSDDLNDTFDKVAANTEAEVLQEPADQFWGVRDAAFRDPAGNTVRIAQR
jgi:uncharacterized glyoxalase superfamily protein PhnB